MRVMALVGSSGTGKSHKAMKIAYENHLDFIVDDGLLIEGAKKMAGRSAKKEGTKVTAVKRALFFDLEHREGVVRVLKENQNKSVLILGTSDKMVENIRMNLELPPFERIIRIEEISTPEEIKIALHHRTQFGKHVVPLPTVELKQDFSGYFRDTLKTVLRRRFGGKEMVEIAEKTVIRPTFSYLGKYSISNHTLVQIVRFTAVGNPGVNKISKVAVERLDDGVRIHVELIANYTFGMMGAISDYQKGVHEMLEHMTMMNVMKVNILVKAVHFDT